MKFKFTLQDQILFAKKLSILVDSGVSLVEALHIMQSMARVRSHKLAFDFFISQCEQGISLSKSLIQSGVRFDPLMISLVRSGEHSGSIAIALRSAHESLEKRSLLQKKVASALVYPLFIFVATTGMTLFLVLYIFPKILPLLNSLNIPLPLMTRAVKHLYEFSIQYGIQLVLLGAFLAAVLYFVFYKVYLIRKFCHALALQMPLFRTYIQLKNLSSVSTASQMLLSSGVSLHEVHGFLFESLRNPIYKSMFGHIRNESKKGVSLSDSLLHFQHIIPRTMVELCSIGEKTGNLADMFGHCARIFEQDIDQLLKKCTALLEPTLMVIMGLAVGSIALSIILPIYEITNHLNR